jgi:TusA-related sulfurtransferase
VTGSPSHADEPELVVDARGRRCPLPVIDLARALPGVRQQDVVEVLADDPAAATDIPAWCRMRGHGYLGTRPIDDGSGSAYRVRRLS